MPQALFTNSITNAANHVANSLAKLYVRHNSLSFTTTSAYVPMYKKQKKSYYIDMYCTVFQ